MLYFEDLKIGDTRVSEPLQVSEEEIITFAEQFDPQPFHIDPIAASDTIFGGLIASGVHSVALWRKLDDQINGDIAFICGVEFDKVRMLNPLRPGDKIHLHSEIKSAWLSRTKVDRGYVKIAYKLYNQNEQVVMALSCTSLVKRRGNGNC